MILTKNYFEYMALHFKIRKQSRIRRAITMLLHKIEQPGNCLSSYERQYVTWVIYLRERKINIKAIKEEIKKLQQSFKGCKLHHLEKDVIRFTKLCALQAALRGKMHFSPKTNIAESIFYRKLPVAYRAFDRESGKWEGIINLEVQRKWVSELAEEFCEKGN